MLRLLTLLGLLCLAFAPHQAQARAQHPQTFFFCPFGATAKDDCIHAPQPGLTPGVTGTFWHTDCFAPAGASYLNKLMATTTDYSASGLHPRDHNMAGCDFPIGLLNTPRQDVATINWTGTGCTYNPTGSGTPGGNPSLNCTSAWTGPLRDVDFAGNANHGCVTLFLPTTGGGLNGFGDVINDHFQDNTGVCRDFFETLFGGGGSGYDLRVTNSGFEGFGLQARNHPNAAGKFLNTSGKTHVKYISAEDFYSRPWGYGPNAALAGNDSVQSMRDSFVKGWSFFDPAAHGELTVNAGCTTPVNMSFDFNNNMLINTTSMMVWQTVVLTTCLAGVNSPVPLWNMSNNFIGAAFPGGMALTTTVTGCMGGLPPTGSTCDTTTHGANFYVITATGDIGTGALVGCTPVSSAIGVSLTGGTSAGIGGGFHGGAGSSWGVDLKSDAPITGIVGGVVGNTFTVTTAGDIDLQVGYVLPAFSGFTSATITVAPAGGGVGVYTISGSAQTVAPGTAFTASPAPNSIYNTAGGNWSMPPQTCNFSTGATGSRGAVLANYFDGALNVTSTQISNNLIDGTVYAPSPRTIYHADSITCTNAMNFYNNADPSGIMDSILNAPTITGTPHGTNCTPVTNTPP